MKYQAYFENISIAVTDELSAAKHTIHIAMAWFTDEHLFKILCDKAREGVIVKVLILNDVVNTQSGIGYTQLLLEGGLINLVGSRSELMHHKFCVIDNKTTITGSYNWTNAARQNNENIIVVKDNFNFANAFVNEYYKLYQKYVVKLKLTFPPYTNRINADLTDLKIVKTHSVPSTDLELALGIKLSKESLPF